MSHGVPNVANNDPSHNHTSNWSTVTQRRVD